MQVSIFLDVSVMLVLKDSFKALGNRGATRMRREQDGIPVPGDLSCPYCRSHWVKTLKRQPSEVKEVLLKVQGAEGPQDVTIHLGHAFVQFDYFFGVAVVVVDRQAVETSHYARLGHNRRSSGRCCVSTQVGRVVLSRVVVHDPRV